MPQYNRAFVPGGTLFFTVALLERRGNLLTEHLDNLRATFLAARQRRPFTVNAIVVLLTCIESGRCLPRRRIFPPAGMISKHNLPPKSPEGKDSQPTDCKRENEAFGSGVFGNTSSATSAIMSVTWITSITIR